MITGVLIDRLQRRLVASINFAMQAIALAAMIAFPTRPLLYIACVGFGLGVGNLISLPALIVQQEFPKEHFGQIISLIVALNQFTFAFGPGLLGIIRDATGNYSASLLLCIVLQGMAAGSVLLRHHAVAKP